MQNLLLLAFHHNHYRVTMDQKPTNLPHRIALFEMLQSYITLARTLNLSETAATLGITRQTIRRHIDILEHHRGEVFFEVRNKRYHLTEAGTRSLKEAEAVVSRGTNWLSHRAKKANGLEPVNQESQFVFSQEHTLSRLWVDSPPLLQYGFQCWAKAKASIESPEFAKLRPYWLIYRQSRNDWICVEIGEQSSYASWFGWIWAKSSVGSPLSFTLAGLQYASHNSQIYHEVHEGSGIRLDHIHTRMPREKDGQPVPVSFQRLLFNCTFPNGDHALAVLVARTYSIDIDGLNESRIREMPESLLMEFDPGLNASKDG